VQRRLLLAALLFAASIATVQVFAQTDPYPSRPVRMVIPFAPGGASDFIGRILQPKLGEELGQQVVVENRAGASGGIGVEAAATATPDGYTFLLGNVSALGIGPSLFSTIRKNERNLVPVTLVVDVPGALGINGGLPPNNLKEFIAYARANEGKRSASVLSSRPESSDADHASQQIHSRRHGARRRLCVAPGAARDPARRWRLQWACDS